MQIQVAKYAHKICTKMAKYAQKICKLMRNVTNLQEEYMLFFQFFFQMHKKLADPINLTLFNGAETSSKTCG